VTRVRRTDDLSTELGFEVLGCSFHPLKDSSIYLTVKLDIQPEVLLSIDLWE
jgi:hypothetical protein